MMKKNDYFIYTAAVFIIVALVHGSRIYYNWSLTLGPWEVPMWLSWVAFILTAILAYNALQLNK